MAPISNKLHLFRRSKELERKIDDYFDKLSEATEVYQLAVRAYLNNGTAAIAELEERLERVNSVESEADELRRDIERHLYTNTLIPDSRGDVLGLIETVDQVMSKFEGSLWSFVIEKPDIPSEFIDGYKALTGMVIKAVDQLGLGARAFFRNPHDIPAYNLKVRLYEKEADVAGTELKKLIFASDLDLASKLHLREFLEQIDSIADLAEDVSDRLAIYAIKRTA